MAAFEPFGEGRQVAVAVSGGADSMALALLLASWGRPVALIVDHGLRTASASEAALAALRLDASGIVARVLPSLNLPPGPGMAERARVARYAALAGECGASGLTDLLVAHHAQDQAETVLLRQQAGSGPAGLAGMASVTYGDAVRVLRPFLSLAPARLRSTLRAAGVAWIEDPTNSDLATPRARFRAAFQNGVGLTVGDLSRRAHDYGVARHTNEAAIADELAQHVTLLPSGIAVVAASTLSPAALSALVWTISGMSHPPAAAAVARLAGQLRPATLHGTVTVPSRLGWLMGREAAAVAPPQPADAGALWDGRFCLTRRSATGCTIGALGDDAVRLRRWSSLPAALLRTLPAIRYKGALVAVPHLSYPDAASCRMMGIAFNPARPAAVAPFSVA